MKTKKYIPQASRVSRRIASVSLPEKERIYQPYTPHHELVKANVVDGVTSTTGLFDEALGDVPSVFRADVDKFELADALMRDGLGKAAASGIAEDGPKDLE